MEKRIVFGFIWSVVLYVGLCMLVGGAAGFIASAKSGPGADPSALGSQAGSRAVLALRPYLGIAAIAMAAFGAYCGILPGTKNQRPQPETQENIFE